MSGSSVRMPVGTCCQFRRGSLVLISHRYRFIYTKTAKTAGTSVESFFERFCMPEGAWQQTHARVEYVSQEGIIGHRAAEIPTGTTWWNHMPAALIRDQIGQDVWDSYFKFCVIRNPFDKCISAFCHLGQNYDAEQNSVLRRALSRLRNERPNSEQRRFIRYLENAMPVDRDNYLIDGEFCMDDVIRYETLQTDIERICQRIGVEYDSKFLPTFKKGIRSRNATIESLYTDEARALVEKKFDFELEYFGYRFPGTSLG
jgi:hypothetical protein